jgi:hypothetical protein
LVNQAQIIEQLINKGGLGVKPAKGGIDAKYALELSDKIEALSLENNKIIRDFRELGREKLQM